MTEVKNLLKRIRVCSFNMLSLVSEADIKTEYKSFGNKKRQGQKNNKLLWYIIKVVL